MEEKRRTGRHFTMNMLQSLSGHFDAFRVSACLTSKAAVLDPSHSVGAPENLKAAILPCSWVNCYKATCHIWKQASILIPIAIVLMPFPCPADARLFQDDLRVIVINLPAQEGFHSIDNARQSGYKPERIISGVIPPRKADSVSAGVGEFKRAV